MSDDDDFLRWLEMQGYAFPHLLPDGRYACLNQRIYNTQVIVGRIGDKVGFSDAW